MEVYLKKYFWVLNFAAVIVCAVLAAEAVNHLVEARFLSDDPRPQHDAPARARRPKPPGPGEETLRSKDGAAFATRNMFCSTCEPEQPGTTQPTTDTGPASNEPPQTSLPLELVATNVANADIHSFATIRNTTALTVGAYKQGDQIPDAGPIEKIRARYVDFKNTQSNRTERIALLVSTEPHERPGNTFTPPPATAMNEPRDDMTVAMDEGIKKVDDTHYEVSRALVEKFLANPIAIRGARIVPSIKNGKANGFKLYAIRPNSPFARIGLQNGDTIHAVNGFELTSPDKALEVYTKVREASSLSVSVTRRGNPVNLSYTIR